MRETNVGIGGEMLNIFEKEKFVYLKKMYYICRC